MYNNILIIIITKLDLKTLSLFNSVNKRFKFLSEYEYYKRLKNQQIIIYTGLTGPVLFAPSSSTYITIYSINCHYNYNCMYSLRYSI